MAVLTSTRLTTFSLVLIFMLLAGNLDKCLPTEATEDEIMIVRLGSKVTLPCQNGSYSTNKVKIWKFNNSTILYAGSSRYAPANLANIKLDGTGSLLIEGVESKNEGSYTCQIDTKVILNRFVVIIEVLPALSMEVNGDSIYDGCEVSSQRSYQVECNATGSNHNVSISWSINNTTYVGRERVTRTTGSNSTINTESVILYRPNIGDREISCLATGQTNSSVKELIKLSVYEEASQPPKTISAKYGENVILTCKSSTMMAMWEFPIRDNTKILNEGEILQINRIRIKNEGEYKCFKAGEATEFTNLTVQVIPKLSMKAIDEDDLYDNVTVFTYKLYKLYCNSVETRPPATISWKINNKTYVTDVKTSNRISQTNVDTWNYYSVLNYIPSSKDKYVSCSIRDDHSGLQWTKSLIIESYERPPHLIHNISVVYGNNVSFSCDFKQKDDFLWKFSGYYDHALTPVQLESVKEFKDIGFNSNGTSYLHIEDAKTIHEGKYTCYKLNESAVMFVLEVIVTPRVEVSSEDNPGLYTITVHRFKPYLIQCLVSGAYPLANISWKVNGVVTVDGVRNGDVRPNTNATDLFDYTSTLYYQPNINDENITCLLIRSGRSNIEQLVYIEDVITFDTKIEAQRILHGSNGSLRCNYSNAVERLYWSFEGVNSVCVERKCNLSNVVYITSSRNEAFVAITNLNAANEGKYSCYHGLEEIKIIHLTMEVKLSVYLMPGIKRLFPDTIELYEGSKYTLVCIANSTSDIKPLKWQVNGVYVSDKVTAKRDNSSMTLRQVTSQYHYTSVISHLTISCIAEGDDGTIITERVKIHLVLSFRKKVMLSGGVAVFLLLLATILVVICRCCSKCTKKKMALDNSIELPERSNELRDVDTAAWRRAMNAFAERSSSKGGLIRRSRMFTETNMTEFDETGDIYDRLIARSFQSSVVPFSRLSFVVKLKSGTFKDRWMGKLRQRTMVKIGTFISAVSENASEDHKFRWDMFVKDVIDIPFTKHIARIIGVSMDNGRLYLLQEFLTVEILKTYMQSNINWLITTNHIPRNILRIARGVVDGMDYLAHNKFCHPALSINKILYANDGECKLYDFCLLEDAPDKIESMKSKRKRSFSNLAKETILQGEYSLLSDVWSVGTALWEIFSLGDEPFQGLHQEGIRRLLQQGHQLPQPAHCSRQVYHVMLDCWVDKTERPTLSTIRNHLNTAIQEYIDMVAASSSQGAGTYTSSADTYTRVRHTYGFSAYSHKRPEENIYEKMDETPKTITK